jgi:hypothetical protein
MIEGGARQIQIQLEDANYMPEFSMSAEDKQVLQVLYADFWTEAPVQCDVGKDDVQRSDNVSRRQTQ